MTQQLSNPATAPEPGLARPLAPAPQPVSWASLPIVELVIGLCLFLLSWRISPDGEYSLERTVLMFLAASLVILYGAFRNPYAPIYCFAVFTPLFTAYGTNFALILGSMILVFVNRREIGWHWHFSAAGTAFCIWSVASLAWAERHYFGQDSFLIQTVPPMVLAFIIAGIPDQLFRRNLVLLVVAGCTISSVFSLRHYLLGVGEYGGGRVFGLIRPDVFSAWEVFGVLGVAAWLVADNRPKYLRPLLAGSALLILVGLGTSGERAAIVAACLGLFMMSLCTRHIVKGIALVAVLAAAALLLYVVEPGVFAPVLERFQTISEDRGSDRLEIWRAGFRAFQEKPLIGFGAENFRFAIGNYYGAEFLAHSIYIGTLVELGIVGTGLMSWWFAVLLRRTWRAEDRLWVFPLLCAYLFHAAFLHEFYFSCFWLALGLAEGSRGVALRIFVPLEEAQGTMLSTAGSNAASWVPMSTIQSNALERHSSFRIDAG